MATYNGHPSYNAWNVSLWINNDEGLYLMAKAAIRDTRSKNSTMHRRYGYSPRQAAAILMKEQLSALGQHSTPDGVPYSETNIRRAMRDM